MAYEIRSLGTENLPEFELELQAPKVTASPVSREQFLVSLGIPQGKRQSRDCRLRYNRKASWRK
jgi:hypothetical protein